MAAANRLEKQLINGFSLVLSPGSRVALVGGSGSSKSIIAKLVSELYSPWSEEVLVDGMPRDNYPCEVLANSVAMVDQDIRLFKGSPKENLTLWNNSIPSTAIVRATLDRVFTEIAGR